MNRTPNTPSRHRHISSNLGRFGSITTGLFQRRIYVIMLIASVFRADCVNGFFSRATTSIYASLRTSQAGSIVATATTTTTTTAAFVGNKNSAPYSFRSSSSLALSKSSSPSSSIKTRLDGNFHAISLSIPTMEMMEEVGALIAILSQPTDVIFLDGDLGAGKTTFSRGFIKCKLGIADDEYDDESDDQDNAASSGTARVQQSSLRITSPTYLLSNTYEYREDDDDEDKDRSYRETIREIHHMDLYRLSGKSPRDFEPLGLAHVFSNCISLIEWPSRLEAFPELLPPEETLLKIDLRIPDPVSDERVMSLVSSAKSSWTTRLQYLIDEGMVDDLLLNSDNDQDDDDDDINDDGKD